MLQVIHIINPSNLSVVANITRDNLGAPLTNNGSIGGDSSTSRTWNDAVLVEVDSSPLPKNGSTTCAVSCPKAKSLEIFQDLRLLQNPSLGIRQVFVNEGDVYQYSNGSQYSYVSVIDTVSQTVSMAYMAKVCRIL